METIEQRKAKGRDVYQRMFNSEKLSALEASISGGEFGSGVSTLAQEFAFGSVWARPGLDPRIRSVITIATLIALRSQNELEKHLQAGLNLGLTKSELEEIIIQTIPYAGFPAAAQAMEAAQKVLEARAGD